MAQPQERRRSGETDKGFVKVVPDPKPQHEPGSAAARGRFAALGEAHREQGKRAAIKTGKAFGKAGVRVVETGEELDYRLAEILDDPRER
jgi:hypothetical protein